MQKTYILKPTMTFKTLPNAPASHKPSERTLDGIVTTIMPGKARAVPANKPRFVPPPQPLPCARLVPDRPALKLGLDVHLEFIMVVAQRGHLSPQAPRQFMRPQLVEQVKRWVAEGLAVYCVQESCGFGFVLHRELVDAGAQSLLITPIALNDRRKTDKLDARALCLRLSRYLDGNRDELAPIRVPSPEEQRKREGTRRRQFLKREVRCLANRGHGQVAEYCHQKLPHRWWGTRNWRKLSAVLDAWLLGVLERLRELIVALEAQIDVLEAQLVLRVAGLPRPKGLGEITLVTLDAEVCDWKRFHNRKQIGSYTGCCPGEHSSGGKRLVGSIDRMGNGRVRALLVEAVWRFLLWQPGWKAAAKMKVRLADGPAMRKKTVVALARQLAVDLWRWRTGRCTLADLGLIPA
jgi:transposase